MKKDNFSRTSRLPAYSPERGWMNALSSGKYMLKRGRIRSSVTLPPPNGTIFSPTFMGRR